MKFKLLSVFYTLHRLDGHVLSKLFRILLHSARANLCICRGTVLAAMMCRGSSFTPVDALDCAHCALAANIQTPLRRFSHNSVRVKTLVFCFLVTFFGNNRTLKLCKSKDKLAGFPASSRLLLIKL